MRISYWSSDVCSSYLIGGMVLPLFAAFYYWIPMMSRRALSERLGKWIFWLMFVGMHVTFLPMHLTGFMGLPRGVYTYLPGPTWGITNKMVRRPCGESVCQYV